MTQLHVLLRGLARTPGFTFIAVVSLALGIGANTAIFSLLDQLVLRMLPVKNPRELVLVYSPGPHQGSYSSDEPDDLGPSFSYPMFRDLQKAQTPFTGLAAARLMPVSLSYHDTASPGSADTVSGNYFEVLGVSAAIGRVLDEEDDRNPGERAVAVLSYDYWVTGFGADPAVLNQRLLVNGYPLTIVGVAQRGFSGVKPGSSPDVFVPITMKKEVTPGWDGFTNRKQYWVTLFARLKPGVSVAQATAAMNAAYAGPLQQDVALLSRPSATLLAQFRAKKIVLQAGAFGRGGLRDETRQPALLLMGMTTLVLLISCANVANLQLARAAARTREVAVRLAIGASRVQLVVQLLLESSLVAIGGGALGLFAAWGILRGFVALLPPHSGYGNLLSANLDAEALVFCLAVSIATGFLFGLFPALQTTRPDVNGELKNQSGQSTASGAANAFRKTLVSAQVAISLLLLISAGLFARTLVNLRNVDLGLRTDHLLMFSINPKLNRYTDQAAAQFYDQLSERLSALPGVISESEGLKEMMDDDDYGTNVTVPGFTPASDDDADSNRDEIGAGYFRTLGIALVSGREFTKADQALAPKVAIVNQEFARHFFAGQNPLGRRFARGGGNVTPDIEIVGVVKDTKYSSVQEGRRPVYFTPHRQEPRQDRLYFYLRTAIDPEQVAPEIRAAVASLDPNLPIRGLQTMDQQIDADLFAQRILSTLTVSFAALATLLAALGLYGVLAYNIARRTREIGIRMALGADPSRVRGLVLREVAWMVFAGTVVGIACAAAAGTLVQNLLYGLKAWDAAIYSGSALALWLIALAAAYLPARRATAVDPLAALRYE